MALVTTANLDAEFGATEMTQLGIRDADAIIRAQDWAEGVALAYLNAAAITVPTPTPNELVGYVCDLIRWRLYDDAITEVVKLRYDAAIAWFNALVAGRIKPTWAEVTTGGMAWSEPELTFTRLVW